MPAVLLLATGLAFAGLASVGRPHQAAAAATRAFAASMVIPLVEPPGSAQPLDVIDTTPHRPMIMPVVSHVTRASRDRRSQTHRFVRPDIGAFSSGFGMRWGRMHEGIDLAGPYGSNVRAVTDAVVVEAGQESGYGTIIRLTHFDGTQSVYGHLSQILVQVGQHVSAGDVIGLEGNTGHSTGPHLHFEIRIGGVAIDPIPWLRARGIYI